MVVAAGCCGHSVLADRSSTGKKEQVNKRKAAAAADKGGGNR